MTRPPLIGITEGQDKRLEGFYVLRREYVRSIESAGGVPVILAPSGPALHPHVLDQLDGVLVSGGGDVEPEIYRARRAPEVVGTSPERDEYELQLITEMLARKVPLLGICRGMQLLNIALGGTLIQHIPKEVRTPIVHLDEKRDHLAIAHDVALLPGTILRRIFDTERIGVNSFHHQAVFELGRGLATSAVAQDGIIEAIELLGAPFVVGVQ